MRISKIMKPVFFVLGLVVINWILTIMMFPRGYTYMMWKGFWEEENIDMVYLGSSFTQEAFNPAIIDESLGTSSYNMGSSGQSLNQTYLALEQAIEKKQIKRAVLAIGVYSLQERKNDAYRATFIYSMKSGLGPLERLKADFDFMFEERYTGEAVSINFLFPWIYKHTSPENLLNNTKANINILLGKDDYIQEGTGKDKLDCNGTEDVYKHTVMYKGYVTTNRLVNYNKIGNKNTKTTFKSPAAEKSYEELDKICKLCRDNDVDLIVVSIPRPSFDLISYGDKYFEYTENWKSFFAERDVDYYDFDMVKPEYFEQKEGYFADFEHLNLDGANAFCSFFADFLKERESGADMEDYFYTKEEYLASIDYITNIYFTAKSVEEGILLKANAYHGTGVEVEYQFTRKNPETGEYEILQDYNSTSEYLLRNVKESEEYRIRVNARKAGSDKNYERYYEKTVSK